MKDIPVIDNRKCRNCGLCVSVCACGALKIVDNTVKAVKVDDCHSLRIGLPDRRYFLSF
jgi:Fe-S-cluster-containing hydrogenase component 2